MAFSNPIVGGSGGELVRASIKSPDYVPGVSGWTINRDGSAEFRNVTVQGTIVLTPGQVTNTEIADGAVTDSKITDVEVGKVTEGTTAHDWTLGSRIKTADTGTRVEISNEGFKAFAGSEQTVDISAATGSVTIQGELVSGSSGLRVIVNPSGSVVPEVRWYPNTGSNYSLIYSSGTDFPDEATMHFTSGVNQANTASADMFVAAGIIRLNILDETGTVTNGGALDVAESYVLLSFDDSAGVEGGFLYLLSNRVQLGVSGNDSLQSKGGMLRVENSFIRLRMETSSNTNNGGFLYQDGSVCQIGWQQGSNFTHFEFDSSRFTDHYGQWRDFVDNGSNQGIFTGTVVMTSGASSGSWSFGTTKLGQMIPIPVARDNIAHGIAVTASDASGATVAIDPAGSGAWSVYFWCYQI